MISLEGQQRINRATVAIAGIGGIGGAVAMMLAKAGVGHLIICDYDHFELANTVEQTFATMDSIGVNKVVAASREIHRHGPECRLTTIDRPIRSLLDAEKLVELADVVVF